MRNTRWSNMIGRIGSADPLDQTNRQASLPTLELMEPRLLLSGVHFADAVNYPTGVQPAMIASGDFDNDGITDLATANQSGGTLTDGSISVLLGNGNGTFQPKTDMATDVDPMGIAVGDFNDDGNADIAVVNYDSSTVNYFLGNGNGTFQAKRVFFTYSGPTCIAAGDFNGDGRDDLAIGCDAGIVSVHLSAAAGGFTRVANYGVTSPASVAIADLGNGENDLIVACQTASATVAVWIGNGNGTFQTRQDYAVGKTPIAMAVGDFDGDDYPDLAVTSYTNSTVDVLLGNGDGTLEDARSYDTGLDPHGVAAADFDFDGYPDLAVVSWGNDSVSIMLNDGDGGFAAQPDEPAVGSEPRSIVIGDFNGDGRSDLAVSNSGDDSVSVLLGIGPTASDCCTMINKNATFKFTQAFFTAAFSDPNDLALQQVRITSMPSHGTLKLKSALVSYNQTIPASQLKYLSYTIEKNYAGNDSFDWRGNNGSDDSTLATVLVITTPEATITAGANAVEGGAASAFTVSLNHASINDVNVALSASGKAVAGKNYVRLAKYVTIPAGQTSAQAVLTPMVDGVAKGNLAVTGKVGGGKGYTVGLAKTATITIVDDEPKISITADPNTTSLGGTPASSPSRGRATRARR